VTPAPTSRVVSEAAAADALAAEASDGRLLVPSGNETLVIPTPDILWIESQENYSVVHALGREPQTVRRSLLQWEADLPAEAFQRVSRSLIVGLERIAMVRWQWQGGTRIEFIESDAVLTLGRAATRRLKDRLDGVAAR